MKMNISSNCSKKNPLKSTQRIGQGPTDFSQKSKTYTDLTASWPKTLDSISGKLSHMQHAGQACMLNQRRGKEEMGKMF